MKKTPPFKAQPATSSSVEVEVLAKAAGHRVKLIKTVRDM